LFQFGRSIRVERLRSNERSVASFSAIFGYYWIDVGDREQANERNKIQKVWK
jgi:hypothetical protein